MSPNRRQLLAGGLATPLLWSLLGPSARAAGSAKRLVVVLCSGAWDTTYVFEQTSPSNDAIDGPWRRSAGSDELVSAEYHDTIHGIPLALNDEDRPSVTSFFEDWGDLAVVVNGISMGSIVHDICRSRILTGSRVSGDPDLGAIFGSVHQEDSPVGYLDFSGRGFIGPHGASSARVGNSGQLEVLVVDDVGPIPGPPGSGLSYPIFAPGSADQDRIAAWLAARDARLTGQWSDAGALHQDLQDSRAAAAELRAAGPDLASYLELGQPLDILGQVDLAVDLLSAGLCRAALIDTDLPWDSHSDNSVQNSNFNTLMSGLSYLASGLGRSRLEDDTLVVVLSEFTRTPKLNADDGKDHWPVASALLFGAGLEGGRVVGATDDQLGVEAIDFDSGEVSSSGEEPEYGDLMAGILEAMDVDPAEHLPGATPLRAIAGSS